MDTGLVWRGIIVVILGIVLWFNPAMFGTQLWKWVGIILIVLGLVGIAIGAVRKTS